MQVTVFADKKNKEDFLSKQINANIQIIFSDNFADAARNSSADIYFILFNDFNKEHIKEFTSKPVLINSVIDTLKDLDVPDNFIRFNGWPTFLNSEIWEVAGKDASLITSIFNGFGWKYKIVKDTPGFISARIIAMIINEAYFALGENVSTKNEIDLAMKLGTNYPYGPFEWCEKIGKKNIYDLLKKLSGEDIRYVVAPALEKEFLNLNN